MRPIVLLPSIDQDVNIAEAEAEALSLLSFDAASPGFNPAPMPLPSSRLGYDNLKKGHGHQCASRITCTIMVQS